MQDEITVSLKSEQNYVVTLETGIVIKGRT